MNNILTGKIMIIGGILVTFWNNIRNFTNSIVSIFWRHEYFDGDLGIELFDLIIKNSKVYSWGSREYSNEFVWSKKKQKNLRVIVSMPTMYFCLYNNKIPLILNYDVYGGDFTGSCLSVKYFSFLFSLDDLLFKTQNIFFNKNSTEKAKKSNFFLYSVSSTSVTNVLSSTILGNNNGSMEPSGSRHSENKNNSNEGQKQFIPILKDKGKYYGFDYTEEVFGEYEETNKKSYYKSKYYESLKTEILFWTNNRDWYETRGIVWKRGALLTGKQGTGKSRMVREIAQELNLPIAQFNISDMSSTEFDNLFKNYSKLGYNGNGCIILIEDIDVIFNGRVNILQQNLEKKLLSFDTLINAISGIKENSGIFVIVTTNHIEKLDPALIRPGRLDFKLEVGNPEKEGYEFIAKQILNGYDDEIHNVIKRGIEEQMTVSEFENACIEKAIDCLEIDKQLGILD